MTNIVNSTLPTPNNHSEKNKPDGVFVIKQGKTNYKVKVFFDHSSGLTAEDRLKRIIQAEAEGIESMAKELIARYSHISEDKQKLFAPQKESVGVCPRCGQPVFEGKKNFYCGDRGCGFVLWKNDRFWTSRRKELTKKMAADLLSKGKTKVKGLYSEKKDTTYDAVIVMEDTGGKYINFKTEFTKGKGGR